MKLREYINTVPLFLDFPYTGEYVDEYLENILHIDARVRGRYGELPLYYNNVDDITAMIQSTLFLNKYKYDGLFATTKLTYNPIWNVEGTETTTTTHGATETSNIYADKETTNEQGERITNEKDSTYPYDTLEKTSKEEKDVKTESVTDTTTEKGRTDKTTTGEYVDTTILERKGNIGVTSTQNLIGQEREIVNFVFWDIVLSDIVKEITIPFYEGE